MKGVVLIDSLFLIDFTASEDDSTPTIMVRDLRNTRALEKILTGHEKGVLSLSLSLLLPTFIRNCC